MTFSKASKSPSAGAFTFGFTPSPRATTASPAATPAPTMMWPVATPAPITAPVVTPAPATAPASQPAEAPTGPVNMPAEAPISPASRPAESPTRPVSRPVSRLAEAPEFELLKLGTGAYSGLPYGIPFSDADRTFIAKQVEMPRAFSMLDRIWVAHLDREAVTDTLMVPEGANHCVGAISAPARPFDLPRGAPLFDPKAKGAYSDPIEFVRVLETLLRVKGFNLDTSGAWAIAACSGHHFGHRFLQLFGNKPDRVHWRRAVLCFLRVAPAKMSHDDARLLLAGIKHDARESFAEYIARFEVLRFFAGPGLSDKEAARLFSASLPLELASYVNKWQGSSHDSIDVDAEVTMSDVYKSFLAAEDKQSWLLKDNNKYVEAASDKLGQLYIDYKVALPSAK
ncbi:hypothetical protein H4R19_003958 [Coemansia spiralis]|nr:hypothetical protein H4R19_003958 [Coemansia spiralis]